MRFAGVVVVVAACSSPRTGVATDAPPRDSHHDIDALRPIDADLSGPTDTPVVPCTNTAAEVYAATAQANATLGSILACSVDPVLDAAAIPALVGDGITVTSSVKQYRIAYQTRDAHGGPAVSTARVYLPTLPRAPGAARGHDARQRRARRCVRAERRLG